MGEQKKPNTKGQPVDDYNGWVHVRETLEPASRTSGDRNQSHDCLWGTDWLDGAQRTHWHEGEGLSCLAGVWVTWVETVAKTPQSMRLRSVHSLSVNLIWVKNKMQWKRKDCERPDRERSDTSWKKCQVSGWFQRMKEAEIPWKVFLPVRLVCFPPIST